MVMGTSTTSHPACKLVRSLRSRCDCDHKEGVFYDWTALHVCGQKSRFQNRLGPRWPAKPRGETFLARFMAGRPRGRVVLCPVWLHPAIAGKALGCSHLTGFDARRRALSRTWFTPRLH